MSLTAEMHPAPVAPMRRSVWQKAAGALGTIAALLVVMVASVVVVIAIATRLSPDEEYTVFGHPVMVVLSGSMAPAINTGDLIVDHGLSESERSQLRVGQIITFADAPGSRTIITHRIAKVVHQGGNVLYQTKGDANNAPDASLRPASSVIGTYAGRVPRGGYFLHNIHKPIVLALFLLAPLLWFIAEPLRRWAREEDDKDPSDSDGTGEGETP
jgi:signal peptidase